MKENRKMLYLIAGMISVSLLIISLQIKRAADEIKYTQMELDRVTNKVSAIELRLQYSNIPELKLE